MLDFSNLDGDLSTEGHQAMRFIGTGKFTGHAGELRYVTEDHHGIEWPVTHHDDSGWWWASTVRLEETGPETEPRTYSLSIQTTPILPRRMDG